MIFYKNLYMFGEVDASQAKPLALSGFSAGCVGIVIKERAEREEKS